MMTVDEILDQPELSRADMIRLLSISDDHEQKALIRKAYSVKTKTVGQKVYLRGLIEFSNLCRKNCFYCGIRNDNHKINRYSLSEDEIYRITAYAIQQRFTGIVLQSGEQNSPAFTKQLASLIAHIKKMANPPLRITLSVGEQSYETYQEWFNAGAERYLLRIETANESLYHKIHPDNAVHSFQNRLQCLENLQKIGFQTGTGVMIGLPFQTINDLADDLLFFKNRNMDMIGMGPYLVHSDTPFARFSASLLPSGERFRLSLRMIALLRIIMPDINIVATTALQTIDPTGRESGLLAGANVLMPNLTPITYRDNYLLYDNKPGSKEEELSDEFDSKLQQIGEKIEYNNYGDSIHFTKRNSHDCISCDNN
ncbi:[FeFe] hydrogenase H-cluster radical SAM maturase HydE [Microbacter margulisiae]|uniref:Biotin synthase n=1 Tax=Microbacter margulisiae TaxID=1350067 RepID=A0A7W5H1P5_9PORP|nr:[FeFe] hydrogenase H-cluster radical SAM maturase HydE [Microbacter margulisiae]MBB3187818.1 biotin synthase [Microbacter margulisiae]